MADHRLPPPPPRPTTAIVAATPVSSSTQPREYRKGNWTLQETLALIAAKRLDNDRRASSSSSASPSAARSAELRWKWVESQCWEQGCLRSQNQCNDKWDNLLRDFKKVQDYQSRLADDRGYWQMERPDRKQRNLPTNLSFQVFQSLQEALSHGKQPNHHPPPPPPQPAPPDQVVETSDSSGPEEDGEGRCSGAKKRRRVKALGTSIVQGASALARALMACEERREERHRRKAELEGRRLQVEEQRAEVYRQGLAGLISAVHHLSNAIQALVSDRGHHPK